MRNSPISMSDIDRADYVNHEKRAILCQVMDKVDVPM